MGNRSGFHRGCGSVAKGSRKERGIIEEGHVIGPIMNRRWEVRAAKNRSANICPDICAASNRFNGGFKTMFLRNYLIRGRRQVICRRRQGRVPVPMGGGPHGLNR